MCAQWAAASWLSGPAPPLLSTPVSPSSSVAKYFKLWFHFNKKLWLFILHVKHVRHVNLSRWLQVNEFSWHANLLPKHFSVFTLSNYAPAVWPAIKKFFSPNCPSCVPGLHLKPDNSYDSATVCNTYANISNRLSRLSHVCALIRNFSSTYIEMSWTGLGDDFGVIACLWASVTYTRYYRLFFISATWLHYWWAALWQPQAAAGHL